MTQALSGLLPLLGFLSVILFTTPAAVKEQMGPIRARDNTESQTHKSLFPQKGLPFLSNSRQGYVMKAPLVLLAALFIASTHQTLLGATSGDWTYSVSDNQATITGYSGAGGAVDIPAVMNEISVVRVGQYSSIFGDGNSTVTSVTIPNGVTIIGEDAFFRCRSLASITIPEGVTSIGNSAFRSCTSLASITIPESVTSIGYAAFRSCTSLASITIPESVTSIGYAAFQSCTNLTSITVDADNSNYSSVDSVLFNKLQTLLMEYPAGILDNSYTIPNGVTSIVDYAFDGCTNLTSIIITDSVTSIGDYAFDDCYNLTSITIPHSVTSIGYNATRSCTSLTSITVDAGNLNYSSSDGVLFNELQTLLVQYPAGILDNSYTIPDSVTSIGEFAFDGCTSLTSITIPDSVTSIGYAAFTTCWNLASINIPDSVTSIGNYAFESCTKLVSITIPDSVTSLGISAFHGCTSLASVTLPATLFIGGNYSDYSLLAEQVRVEKTSIDAFVVNAETAARASGARTIVNVSARVTLGSGQMVTPGFVVRDVPTKLLIRAVGPRLGDFGVVYLPDPRMTIFDASQNVVRTIDDWESDNPVSELSDLMTATASAGAFPLEQDTASAATLVTLDPGVYTVQVDSADEGVGDVLVEVYEIFE